MSGRENRNTVAANLTDYYFDRLKVLKKFGYVKTFARLAESLLEKEIDLLYSRMEAEQQQSSISKSKIAE